MAKGKAYRLSHKKKRNAHGNHKIYNEAMAIMVILEDIFFSKFLALIIQGIKERAESQVDANGKH